MSPFEIVSGLAREGAGRQRLAVTPFEIVGPLDG